MIHGPIDLSKEPYDFSELPKLEIDGYNIGSLEEFWDEISEKLIPGVSWGRNLDAFWDILSGRFGTPDEFELVWKNSDLSEERLGYEETVRQLEIRRRKCHPTAVEDTEYRLNLARADKGFTVFDWLANIVRERPEVKLTLK
ncbi:MAG: barstar family protein [Acidobacteriota bacterium]|nr:MAG: barstar family protein [Acidobacteriota bacterium]